MPATEPPPSILEDAGGGFVIRFGGAVGLAVAAALACTFPAAIRVAASLAAVDRAVQHVWVGLATAALAPMLCALLVLRAAREGLRSFAGPGATLRLYGVGLWLAWLVVALSLFGAALRRTTHQHALAGVTFACASAAIAIGAALVSARIVALLRAARTAVRRGVGATLAVLTALALGSLGLAFVRAVSDDPTSAAASGTVLDVLAFVLAAFLASRRAITAFAVRRALALVGPPIAVAVAALGLSALHDAPLRAAMTARAPAFAPLVDLVPER